MDRGKPALIAAAVLLGGFLLSVILFSADLPFLGMVAGFTAIPLAFVTSGHGRRPLLLSSLRRRGERGSAA